MNQPAPTTTPDRAAVCIERCEAYDADLVFDRIKAAVDALGGMGRFVKTGQNVLLKPNLLSPSEPSKAVTTHPAVVEAVIRLVKDAGGHPAIGDSPGIGSLLPVTEKTGIAQVARRHGAEIVPFDESVPVDALDNHLFRQIEIARAVADADVVINLPKVKSHGQMLLTLAVKNLFGCIAGRRKIEWHMRAGRDYNLFARLLVEVCRAVRPALNIADGIVGMEGNGPGSGDPVQLGFVAASADPFALDAVLCSILGVEPGRLLTARAAAEMGLGTIDLAQIDVLGPDPAELRPPHFRLPPTRPLLFFPGRIGRMLSHRLRPKPSIVRSECELCGVCKSKCPAGAISQPKKWMRIDYNQCISCFCCQELCPPGAIKIKRSLIAKLLFR